jgi:hypothetical protein
MLLTLDNHSSYSSAEANAICRKKGIVMVSLPLYTPEVVFYSPLKVLFMESRNLLKITPYDIAEISNRTHLQIAMIAKETSGFKNTWIHPLNPGFIHR